jgi:hypothetical protein
MVAMDGSGNFVVTWTRTSYSLLGTSEGIFAQRFDATGAAVGGAFQVNTMPGSQENAAVAMNLSDNFVVTWSSNDGSGWHIFARRYDSLGVPIGDEFQVSTYAAGDQNYSSVAMSKAGAFVITWSSESEDGDGWGVFAQRYDETGAPVGSEFQVNTTTAGNQMYSKVAMTADGDFTISWESDSGGQTGSKPQLTLANAIELLSNTFNVVAGSGMNSELTRPRLGTNVTHPWPSIGRATSSPSGQPPAAPRHKTKASTLSCLRSGETI